MSKEQFNLEYSLFSALGGLYNGKKTPLSPLGGVEFPALTPDISQKLRAAHILDDQDQPTAGFTPLLQALGLPEAYARLRFIGAAKFIDYAVYFSQGEQISLKAEPTGLAIDRPAAAQVILDDLKLYLGDSTAQNSNFEARLSVDEAVVMAALIDLRRSAFLRALSEHTPLTPAPFDIYMITRIIASGLDQAQWISGMLRTLCALQNPLPTSQVQVALSNLAGKGLLSQTERGFALSDAAAFLCDRLLVINNAIWVEAAHANPQDKVAFVNMVCAQAGLNDLLCMRYDGKEVLFHSSAPASLLAKIGQHLNDPEIVPAPPIIHTTLKLAVMSGPAAGQSYFLKAVTSLGRESECDIQVKDIKISRKHAEIAKVGDGYQLTDLGSTNGTYVNGIAITAPVLLKEGDIIMLGETRLSLVGVAEEGPAVVSEATMYAGSHELPLAGVEIPSAQEIQAYSEPANGKAGPFVEAAPEAAPQLEPVVMSVEPVVMPVEPVVMPVEPVAMPPEAVVMPSEALTVPPEGVVVPPEGVVVPPPPVILPPPEPQRTVCPTCGNPVSPGARFCGSCGQGLA